MAHVIRLCAGGGVLGVVGGVIGPQANLYICLSV